MLIPQLPHRSNHHTGLFCHRFICHRFIWTVVYIVATQVYFLFCDTKVKILHALFTTEDYLPHRFIACFKFETTDKIKVDKL